MMKPHEKSDAAILYAIREHCSAIMGKIHGTLLPDFVADPNLQESLALRLMLIGEEVKKLSQKTLTPAQIAQIQDTLAHARAGKATLAQLAAAHDLAEDAGLNGTLGELRAHIRAMTPYHPNPREPEPPVGIRGRTRLPPVSWTSTFTGHSTTCTRSADI